MFVMMLKGGHWHKQNDRRGACMVSAHFCSVVVIVLASAMMILGHALTFSFVVDVC